MTQYTKGYLKDVFDVKADMDPEERKKKMMIVSSIPEVFSCAGLMDDFIYAVLYWKEEDEEYKLAKSQKKFINIISENYKNDYLNCLGEDEAENLYLRFLMVTDFISGMTDSYAKNLYRELNGID